MRTTSKVMAVLIAMSVVTLHAQAQEAPLPRLVKQDGRYALFVDDAPFLMLAAQVNNSSAWPAMLGKVWPAMEYMNVNTVEIPIYWEQFEPQQGQFDYTLVDLLIEQARQEDVRLVLLWFGTWKNGRGHYMPEWMKLAPDRYPHMLDKNGNPVDSPSPFAPATLEADIRAFTAFMRHLKQVDPQRTVIMVQVQNEPGTWDIVRDYSPAAQKRFEAPVPPEILTAMDVQSASPNANWEEAFGSEAEVRFHAWSVARYVEKVAAAGKAAYPLPLYTNASLRDPITPEAPGKFESGGPTYDVIPIWKVAAPSLDLLAPDIYLRGTDRYLKTLELYRRDDNALFVPETAGSLSVSRFLFSALGLQAIGFAPFGMDYTRTRRAPGGGSVSPEEHLAPWAMNYGLIGPMQREIARLNFEGKLQAVAEEEGKLTQALHFGPWDAIISYGAVRNRPPAGNPEPIGRVLVAQLEQSRFLVAGFHCRVDFHPSDQAPEKFRQYLRIEEGTYENGTFKFMRNWNGDQTDWGLNFGSEPVVLRVSLATY